MELLAEGFHAVKLRLGRRTLWDDVLAVRAVRARIPAEALLMTDFNQALTVAEALARGRALDREGVYWIESRSRHDDYAGAARIAREVETPIQIGENFIGTHSMAAAIAAGAADYVMPDLARIGGVTGWLRAAALADAAGLEMSSHLYPEVSAQLLAVTPSAHFSSPWTGGADPDAAAADRGRKGDLQRGTRRRARLERRGGSPLRSGLARRGVAPAVPQRRGGPRAAVGLARRGVAAGCPAAPRWSARCRGTSPRGVAPAVPQRRGGPRAAVGIATAVWTDAQRHCDRITSSCRRDLSQRSSLVLKTCGTRKSLDRVGKRGSGLGPGGHERRKARVPILNPAEASLAISTTPGAYNRPSPICRSYPHVRPPIGSQGMGSQGAARLRSMNSPETVVGCSTCGALYTPAPGDQGLCTSCRTFLPTSRRRRPAVPSGRRRQEQADLGPDRVSPERRQPFRLSSGGAARSSASRWADGAGARRRGGRGDRVSPAQGDRSVAGGEARLVADAWAAIRHLGMEGWTAARRHLPIGGKPAELQQASSNESRGPHKRPKAVARK